MKALILNSGRGTRLGGLTAERPKCMLELNNGETILGRQLRLLGECGIREFVITTGPYPEQIEAVAEAFSGYQITLVPNPDYESTNYLVSMAYAKDCLAGDVLLLHGDLVFNKAIVQNLLDCKAASACLYHEEKPLPEKDFKAVFDGESLRQVGTGLFGAECYAFQPFYKLEHSVMSQWLEQIDRFILAGHVTVYAEEALNCLLDKLSITRLSYRDHYVEEIDNREDYIRVAEEIRSFDYQEQLIDCSGELGPALNKRLESWHARRLFVVCGSSAIAALKPLLAAGGYDCVMFGGYRPNPELEDIKKGVRIFNDSGCDTIVSAGGGSTMDVAKAIKLLSAAHSEADFLANRHNYNPIRHLAIPTTGGSGSESTRFAVLYHQGVKQSIAHDSILPDAVILSARLLETLPDYHKKATLLDALCQAIESYWAKSAGGESQAYAAQAISLILSNYRGYFNHEEKAATQILLASNLSGRAINLSRTTLPHAMSYQLTKMYGISHGHAVGLCLGTVWQDLLTYRAHAPAHLDSTLESLGQLFGGSSAAEAVGIYRKLYDEMDLETPRAGLSRLSALAASVDSERSGNHPVSYDTAGVLRLYGLILKRQ